ncbi:type II TA system antitoxin MqsA family protein [Rossellomorea aquimaris]|uniref:Putative zinc finger/helix-turn-helix YgiT family protein n=1 Tax=Rossellomorea aquimaris TaxID=189382 RepID=A0A366EC58_9BACI|nr:type II TA system antitoxin MqsA family protein [Rossellomorea aquimaris]RBP00001.1 putative zinc finger/helix-turn-helix YgiT family protein [Rossellomorea aquimaris]
MKIVKSEKKLCLLCMEEHEVETVEVTDDEIFKGEEVQFTAKYEYCSATEDLMETEEMIKANSLAMKDAYREKLGLLTSDEIMGVRRGYDISQKDFSEVLGWGRATITRYENHQVQDRAHDDVLRKISSDPKWFLEKLHDAKEKGRISDKALAKSLHEANEQYKKKKNHYLIDSIYASYADYEDATAQGNTDLNLKKVVEMINYLSEKVNSLHKVKLMKMLWYADVVHFKRKEKSISGMVYNALPMGVVPEGYEQIVLLDGIQFETVQYGENIGYKFKPAPGLEITELTEDEIQTLNHVISEVGSLNTDEIILKMHEEEAYKHTASNSPISYSFAKDLSID